MNIEGDRNIYYKIVNAEHATNVLRHVLGRLRIREIERKGVNWFFIEHFVRRMIALGVI